MLLGIWGGGYDEGPILEGTIRLCMGKNKIVLLIPFHGILCPFCVNVVFHDIFILWYLRCIIFLKHRTWCMIRNIRKECSLCENHYLVLFFSLFWLHYFPCK
jgi:hypothetical protein